MASVLNYGVLSTAAIARNQHIPASKEAGNSRIIAISSREKTTAEKYARELEIPKAYGSYEELLADQEVQAVINPLPNSLHCEWTIRAAEAGKHILCEKPLAPTPEECQRMIDSADANGVLLFEGFTQQFNPLMATVHQLLADGSIGEVKFMKSELTYTLPDWETDVRGSRELAGGALFDAGCYAVNNMRTLMGAEPVQVEAFQRVHERNGVEATFLGLMRFPGDRLAYIATGMEQPFRCHLEVVGTKGWLATPNFFSATELTVSVGGETVAREFAQVNRFALQMEHFADCVLTGKPLRTPPEDGKGNAAALVALKKAADTGQVVSL
jgi:predicted dehydrogenase